MSIIKHGDGISLEFTVRGVYDAQRFDMGGIINSDYFDSHPYEASLLALSPFYYQGILKNEISKFLEKYSFAFEYPDEIDDMEVFTEQYINELNELVKSCKQFL